MIYTITFNPSLDYIMSIEEFKSGATNRSQAEKIVCGGKGFNVSMVLNEFGIMNQAIGFVAGFSGEEIERLLKKKGVNHELFYMSEGFSRINIKLKGTCESEINGAGPKMDQKAIQQLKKKIETMNENDTVAICGSLRQGIEMATFTSILALLKAQGVRLMVDMSGEALQQALAYKPWLIKPNLDELSELMKRPIHSYAQLQAALIECRKYALNVLVSFDKDGAVLLDENQVFSYCCAPKGQVKNSVGAGDAMLAGFLTAYCHSHSYEKALRMGVACGSAAAFDEDFGRLKQYMRYYEELTVQQLDEANQPLLK